MVHTLALTSHHSSTETERCGAWQRISEDENTFSFAMALDMGLDRFVDNRRFALAYASWLQCTLLHAVLDRQIRYPPTVANSGLTVLFDALLALVDQVNQARDAFWPDQKVAWAEQKKMQLNLASALVQKD
jgi:hypothetical protein